MTRTKGWCSAAILALAAGGCSQAPMDMSKMEPLPRSTELDRLDMFVGTWQGTGECAMAGMDQKMACNGRSTFTWDLDKRFVIERAEYQMGDSASDKMTGIGVYTWDPYDKQYKSWWFDSMGASGAGTMAYDEGKKEWCFKVKGTNPMTGEASIGRGTMRYIENNLIEWSWSEWDSWGLKQTMEMKGTSKRM